MGRFEDTPVKTSGIDQLKAEFEIKMLWICDECQLRTGYQSYRFKAMVFEKTGVGAAKDLLKHNDHNSTVAYDQLSSSEYFRLTMEYVVVQNKYRSLFDPKEIQ